MIVGAYDLEELQEIIDRHDNLDHIGDAENSAQHLGSAYTAEFILANMTGEVVFWQEVAETNDGLKTSSIKECKVEYTPDGKAYFEPNGRHSSRRYLKNFLKKNYYGLKLKKGVE